MHPQFLDIGSSAPELEVFCFDNNGDGVAVAHNAVGLQLAYQRNPTDNIVNLTLVALASATAAYTANGWFHKGGGVHRLCLPTAAAAAGAQKATVWALTLPAGVRIQPIIAPIGFFPRLSDDELALEWGATSQPAGGSTVLIPVRRGGSQIGVVRYYYDAANRFAGRTALTPS